MAQYFSSRDPDSPVPSSSSGRSRETNGLAEVDDPESAVSTVARLLEQLHGNISSPVERELVTSSLLTLARDKKEARVLIGTHSQAMPLIISILRTGNPTSKSNIASLLTALCKEDDLRIRILLGGCIPPLLSLLKSDLLEGRKAASEAIFAVSHGGLSDDHIGMKIFVTEGVVPTLWAQLSCKIRQNREVEGFLTGALRNLCRDKDGYWRATLEAGGVEIITDLLSSGNPTAQMNSASLLARLVSAFGDSVSKVIEAGSVKALIRLLGRENEISARASAADALEVLSLKSIVAKKAIVDAGGLPVLIGSVIAPSKECMQGGESCRSLQNHAVRALSNICGGISKLILYLGEISKTGMVPVPLPDALGALAYSLMVFDEDDLGFEPAEIETVLIGLLKPSENKLVQDRVLEALASLFGNNFLTKRVKNSAAKRVMIGLITMASIENQEQLIPSLTSLCCEEITLWDAIKKREGVQLLISLLGLSSEQQQEHAVSLLGILTDEMDESKWAITAAGGIPPLVQLLESGSHKAKEDAAHVLWNLCSYSEDIRACVESAGAVSSLLWLLKSGGPKGQEASAKALKKLIRNADPTIVNQLLVQISSELTRSKCQVITVLGHVLVLASLNDLVRDGSTANKGLRSLIRVLNEGDEKMQEKAASVLADLFITRPEICDSLATDEVVNPCMKLLTSGTQGLATQSARALGAFSKPKSSRLRNTYLQKGDVAPLIEMAKTVSIDSAETAISALANLLTDPNIAQEALERDIVFALKRVLKEGSLEGKKSASRSMYRLLNHFPLCDVVNDFNQCRVFVHLLVDSLADVVMENASSLEALDVLALMVREKVGPNFGQPVWVAFSEGSENLLLVLMRCLDVGSPSVQDKAIEILSRVCVDNSILIGQCLGQMQGCILSLASRVIECENLEVKIGGASLLICGLKETREESIRALCGSSEMLERLVCGLVDLMRRDFKTGSLEIEIWNPKSYSDRNDDDYAGPEPARVLGGVVAEWLLGFICLSSSESRVTFLEAGGIEILCDKLSNYVTNPQAEYEEMNGIWTSTLLLSILFQDPRVINSSPISRIMPSLVSLLKSDDLSDRYFAAQALSSLVCTGEKGTQLSVANSGAVSGLITLMGHVESNLTSLSTQFELVLDPSHAIMKRIFDLEEVVTGTIARRSVPSLVDLLRPIPDRPGAPLMSLELLTILANSNDSNKITMAESGVLDSLTKYLSLSPQDSTEASITNLISILYTNSEILSHESSLSTLNQLLAVLRLGSRNSRLFAARALKEMFKSETLRETEMAKQAIKPLIDMLNSGNEKEQREALSALIRLASGNISRATSALTESELDPLDTLCKILSFSESFELKKDAAQFSFLLFQNPFIRQKPIIIEFIRPLIQLVLSGINPLVGPAVCALDLLLDDEENANLVASYDLVDILVKYISRDHYELTEASLSSLIKLGKDRPNCKLDMINSGVIDKSLEMLLEAPPSVSSLIVELFRILTNNSGIARSSAAAPMVEPLFLVLQKPEFTVWGQHSALQALINILEKPQSLTNLKLTPSQVIEPLIVFLESPSPAIQQLGTEVLMHLLEQEHFKRDITTKNAVVPLVQLAGIGILSIQQTAIRALENISLTWPKVVADSGGIFELSKVILQEDPVPTQELWESTALVLSNILRSSTDNQVKISMLVLVRLLGSAVERTVTVALSALMLLVEQKKGCAVSMAEAGAIKALLELLKSHQCEEACGRLLEVLFNNVRVRQMKVAKQAIGPLALYLLDPLTICQPAKLYVTLSLGDLFQHENLARSRDSVSACRALIGVLEEQINEDMTCVALCALQSLVMNSRTNRRAVAEAGGVLVVQELLLHPSADVANQAALLIKYLFSNHTLQEYVSNELIRSLTAALERDLLSTTTANIEALKTIHVIFSNFRKLCMSESATLCIPHLVSALSSGSEPAQEAVLDTLSLLKDSWPHTGEDIAKAQSLIAAEAIPVLQVLIRDCPPSFHERADGLLHCLPGCLTVTVKRGNNLKQTVGSTNAFCCLKIGNSPPRETRVVSHSTSPEWMESFTWAFDVPPKGQKLYIICKSKNTFGKSTLGRVTIQIDKVLTEGIYSGPFGLSQEGGGGKDSSRTLEIEIVWSNRTTDNSME